MYKQKERQKNTKQTKRFSIVMEWTAVLKGHLADGKVCVCVCRRFIIPACWKRLSERRAIITQRDWWQRLWVWETALLMDHPVSHFIPFKKKKKKILPHLPSRQSRSLLFLYIYIFPLIFFIKERDRGEEKKLVHTTEETGRSLFAIPFFNETQQKCVFSCWANYDNIVFRLWESGPTIPSRAAVQRLSPGTR